jgi:hypothetical protein
MKGSRNQKIAKLFKSISDGISNPVQVRAARRSKSSLSDSHGIRKFLLERIRNLELNLHSRSPETITHGGRPIQGRDRYVGISRRNQEGNSKLWMYMDNQDIADPETE